MKEFGSDFHIIGNYKKEKSSRTVYPNGYLLMADGRQCILELIRHYRWKRIWMPAYFCYNIIEYIQNNSEIEIVFYEDYPGCYDGHVVATLPYADGDVLFRMNYFGLRAFRSEQEIPVPVIEDHSHDLVGDWAKNSNADWCIASLRKIVPIPEGGIMWSPKGYCIPSIYQSSATNEELSQKRWKAMDDKSKYLQGLVGDKDGFRKLYLETEDAFDELDCSSIDDRSRGYFESFDIEAWNYSKKKNWEVLNDLFLSCNVEVACPENRELVPFSLIALFETEGKRNDVRKRMIAESIYPAVLWNVPNLVSEKVKDFSKRMLSIHCDGRYDDNDIKIMLYKLQEVLRYD